MAEKILIIDDSPTISSTVEWLLCNHGYEVMVANDGLTALSHVQRFKPDLILLDIRLPHIDGFKICQLIRRKSEHAELPIVMLSGLSGEDDVFRALEAGADDYLTKPVDDNKLLAIVGAHLMSVKAQ